jgi:hypothetical protein
MYSMYDVIKVLIRFVIFIVITSNIIVTVCYSLIIDIYTYIYNWQPPINIYIFQTIPLIAYIPHHQKTSLKKCNLLFLNTNN